MDPLQTLKDLEDALIEPEFDLDRVSELIEAYVDWVEKQGAANSEMNKRFEALLTIAREKAEAWDNIDT